MIYKQIGSKVAIILSWLMLIILFLFSPKLKQALQATPSKSINVYVWTDEISPEMVDLFERETGIAVHLSYFETNEELYAKMQYTRGAGYDLIMPSGFMIPSYVANGLLKKIDKSKIDFWQYVDPNLTDKYFDPNNEHSLPFHFDIACIGYDKRFYPETPGNNWDIIFNNKTGAPRVGMTNDARESVLLTAKYLFGTTMNLSKDQILQLSKFLHRQKSRVAAYTDLRADYLLESGSAQAAVSQISFILLALKKNEDIGMLVPQQTFAMIDSFSIPQVSQKEDMVYQFLNFLFRSDVIKFHLQEYASVPAVTYPFVIQFLKKFDLGNLDWSQISFFRTTLSNQTINQIWLDLKSY